MMALEPWQSLCSRAAAAARDLGLTAHAAKLQSAKTMEDALRELGVLEVSLDAVVRCARRAGLEHLAQRAEQAFARVYDAFEECQRVSGPSAVVCDCTERSQRDRSSN